MDRRRCHATVNHARTVAWNAAWCGWTVCCQEPGGARAEGEEGRQDQGRKNRSVSGREGSPAPTNRSDDGPGGSGSGSHGGDSTGAVVASPNLRAGEEAWYRAHDTHQQFLVRSCLYRLYIYIYKYIYIYIYINIYIYIYICMWTLLPYRVPGFTTGCPGAPPSPKLCTLTTEALPNVPTPKTPLSYDSLPPEP